jgi:hypothetical protein
VISILRRQAEEIAADPALRAYGAALAGLQLLFAYWIQRDGKLRILAPGRDAICWPLLPECEWLRVLPVEGLEWLLALHGLAALAVGAAFLRSGWTHRAYAGLACCCSSSSRCWRSTSGCVATSTAWRSP